jgi:hypothetical protein
MRRHSPGSAHIIEMKNKEQKKKQSERESELNTVRCKNLGNYIYRLLKSYVKEDR